MGRYYSGDIEGKFWVAVQNSDDAEFFGATAVEPSSIEYSLYEQDIPQVEDGIKKCLDKLGSDKAKLDEFFSTARGYNEKMLEEAGIPYHLLEWYARLELGEKILKCLKEKGQCVFNADF